MVGTHKYIQAMTLPPAEETGNGKKATKAANAASSDRERKRCRGSGKGKRKYTQAQHAKMATYAAENGNVTAVRHFSKVFPGLGESPVRLFKKQSLATFTTKKRLIYCPLNNVEDQVL